MDAILATADLMFGSKLAAAAERTNLAATTVFDLSSLLQKVESESPSLVFLDLSAPWLNVATAVEQLRHVSQPPRSIVAFGPHVQEALLDRAKAAGCDLVLSRGQFNAQMDAVLKRYAVRG
jgi:CheY-like chemotaxis protein